MSGVATDEVATTSKANVYGLAKGGPKWASAFADGVGQYPPMPVVQAMKNEQSGVVEMVAAANKALVW